MLRQLPTIPKQSFLNRLSVLSFQSYCTLFAAHHRTNIPVN